MTTLKPFLDSLKLNMPEQDIIQNINAQLVCENAIFDYKVDSSLTCGKCDTNSNVIRIPIMEFPYPIVIHELLHAVTVYVNKFPNWDELPKLSQCNVAFFNKVRISIINDLHHFLFYKKWKSFTKDYPTVKFVVDEQELVESTWIFRNEAPSSKRDLSCFLNGYYTFYVGSKYRELLKKENASLENTSVKIDFLIEFNRLLDVLFANVIQPNISKENIINEFAVFLASFDRLIKNAC